VIFFFFIGCTAQNLPEKSTKNNGKIYEKKSPKQKPQEQSIDSVEQKLDAVKKRIEVVEQKVQPKIIVKEKIKTIIVEKPITTDSKTIVGLYENVYIPFLEKTFKAKIDTGATTTSMHAQDIKEFERDGKKWVKFKYLNKDEKLIEKSLPVERIVSIKRHGIKENQKRYVVKVRINLGEFSEVVDVSLTNRSKFSYPVLVGRNYLNGFMVVDVSKEYVTKPKKN